MTLKVQEPGVRHRRWRLLVAAEDRTGDPWRQRGWSISGLRTVTSKAGAFVPEGTPAPRSEATEVGQDKVDCVYLFKCLLRQALDSESSRAVPAITLSQDCNGFPDAASDSESLDQIRYLDSESKVSNAHLVGVQNLREGSL